MLWIAPSRVHLAIIEVHNWWLSANAQASKHILPLLALLEQGAGDGRSVRFEERPHEYDFWDRYFRIPGDQAKPYFNPLLRKRAEENFPHSNAATIRKNTFQNRWRAAALSPGPENEAMWTLAPDYAAIYRDKALERRDDPRLVPVIEFAAIMFRGEDFPDGSTARSLEERFRERFPQRDLDYTRIFRFADEPAERLFTIERPTPEAYDEAIASALIVQVQAPPADQPLEMQFNGGEEGGPEDDEITSQVRELLALGSSGFILRGVPGTGKTYHAKRVANNLVSDPLNDIFKVQFHPSYGYEDFVEGYKPDPNAAAGFTVVDKLFLNACARAKVTDGFVVLVIDEINRGDPSRIFGELLTYIERSYRGTEFSLPYSGRKEMVPANLIVIGTMNPHDRSIAQLDAAFIRRFDHILIEPSTEVAASFLEQADAAFTPEQIDRVRVWFDALQNILPFGIGHAFLKGVKAPEHLQLVWQYRMLPACEAALEVDPRKLPNVIAAFNSMYADIIGRPARDNA